MANQELTPGRRLKFGPLTRLLTVLTFLSAGGAIAAETIGIEGFVYALKPLTIGLIIMVALTSADPPAQRYKVAIVAGLFFSMVGDILLMLPRDLFLFGLIAFAVAQVTYTIAFAGIGGFYRSIRAAVPFFLFGLFMAVILWPNLGDMLIPALAYLIIILIMAWQSYGQWRQTGETRALLAFVGVLFFIASDSLLAINRFVYDLESLAPLLVLGTYYPAQWLIAQSAGRQHP